jgi:signal transduction histidine kinase
MWRSGMSLKFYYAGANGRQIQDVHTYPSQGRGVSMSFALAAPSLMSVLEDVLGAIAAAHGATLASLRLVSSDSGVSTLILHQGFTPASWEYFEDMKEGTADARAAQAGRRIIIEDIESDEAFEPHRPSGAVAGFRAVQATPLLSSSGELQGVLSTYFREPHQFSAREIRIADMHAKVAVGLIERARAEGSLLRMQQDLAHVTSVLSMAELAAFISHEMKQPLAAILANAGTGLRWLDQRPLQVEEARATLGRILRDARLATHVLEATRALRAGAVPRRVQLDLNEIIRMSVALVQAELDEYGVRLREDLQALPLIWGDRTQLQQAMLCILVNAIEAVAAVTDRERLLEISSRRQVRRDVVVSIRNSGNAMSASTLEKVFEPFFTTKPDRTGLGLAMCRRIVQAHGGAISVQQNEDRNVTFELALPAGEEHAGMP